MIALQSQPAQGRQVIAQKISDGLVLFNIPSGRHCRCYSLNDLGARVWALCDGSRTVSEIIRIIREEYETPDDRVKADVLTLLRDLAEERLVDVGGARAARGR